MSYTRRFSKTITVHYSGSVSYPASQSGGSAHYSGSTTETIHFNVIVDTDPFDGEMANMRNHVDALTGSVVATKTAHVATISDTSRQIGDTIISGFFKTVKSDISQQIAELRARSEALLVQLNKLAQRCSDKKRQMGEDYQRISARYSKIFTDLNEELKNRIYSIDEPVFKITRSTDSMADLSGANDMVSTVSVSAGEQARVHSMITANLAKAQAANAIEKGHRFLAAQRATDILLNKCLRPGGESAAISTPYCVVHTVAGPGSTDRKVYTSPMLDTIDKDGLADRLDSAAWSDTMTENDIKAISDYFNAEVAAELQSEPSSHGRRVAEMTARLFDLSATETPDK